MCVCVVCCFVKQHYINNIFTFREEVKGGGGGERERGCVFCKDSHCI